MNQDTYLMVIGGFLSAGVIVVFLFLYRLYKRVGRRCDNCGDMNRNFLIRKIRMQKGDVFNPSLAFDQIRELRKNLKPSGIRKFCKEFRWWYRNPTIITFFVCPWCNGGQRITKVVTISHRPVSLCHLAWIWHFDHAQFIDDPVTNAVFDDHNRHPEGRGPVDIANPPMKIMG